jgi:TonB-linked SusC/RagA family outer membrane protein
MKRLAMFLAFFLCVGLHLSMAQTVQITGTVTSSEDGQPLPGASVVVKGTNIGTTTNFEGKYTLSVPPDAKTLVINFVGQNPEEVEIAGQKVVNVAMVPSVQALNEVVVTAFGIKRASREMGTAKAKVSEGEITQAGTSNVVNGLTGKVSGLQINTVNNGVNPDTRITLRGNRHFLASNQALVVLDGVPVSANYLSSINPNDIDNVTVLKGAGASALYGNDASNGVLMITTKKGADKKPVIKISNITTFEQISYMPKLQTRFGSGSGETPDNSLPNYTFWVGPGRITQYYTSFENQSFGPEYNGDYVLLGGKLADGSYQMVKYSPVKNQKENFFDIGISSQNDISYSAGDEKNSFYISAQDVNTSGVIPKDKNRRTGARMSAARTYGKFHSEFTMGYTQTNTNTSGSDFFQQRPVYWNLLNTPAHVPLSYYKDINSKFGDVNGYYNAYYPNPYWQLEHSRNITKTDDLLGSLLVSFAPAKWVELSYRTGLAYTNSAFNYYRDEATFNSYNVGDPWAAGHMAGGHPVWTGVSGDNLTNHFVLTGDFLATFNKKFAQDFSTKLTIGASTYMNKYRIVGVDANSLVVPGNYNINNRDGQAEPTEVITNRNSIGVFGDLTLGYKDFAFVHVSGRNDWDSRLVQENRSFFYPAVDGSLIISDAISALKDQTTLSYAKLRGGWSKTGLVSLSNWYATLPAFGAGEGFPMGQPSFALSRTLSNPNLKPEQTTEVELGLELSFIKNKYHLEISAYKSNTKDQTIPATLSASSGYTSAYINAGELETKGIETDLRFTPVLQLGKFDWSLSLNYSYTRSKVLSIMEGLNELFIYDPLNTSVPSSSYAVIGEQYPSIKVTDVKRDPEGRIIVNPTTGMPIKDTKISTVGHGNPNHIFGINNTFKYKGLTLNAVAEYRSGNVIFYRAGRDLDFTGVSWHSAQNGRQPFVIPNSVIENADGTYTENTDIVVTDAGRTLWTNSDYISVDRTYVVSAAFWKLREVSLSYDIPTSKILKGFIKQAQVGLVGRNLLMYVPKTNTWGDPEFNNQNGNSNAVGYTTVDQTPPTRVYGFKVNLTF